MPFSTSGELRQAIVETDPSEFVSHVLFAPVPFVFAGDLDLWIKWRTLLAGRLEVDPYEIVLTGSSAVGYSLNPTKRFAPFSQASDIDVGVISAHHFELGWRYFRKARTHWLSLPARTRRAVESHVRNYIFSGTIATDFVLELLPYALPWRQALDEMARQRPTVGRDVKIRVYRDFDALRGYQAYGIRSLRDQLLESSADEEIVGQET